MNNQRTEFFFGRDQLATPIAIPESNSRIPEVGSGTCEGAKVGPVTVITLPVVALNVVALKDVAPDTNALVKEKPERGVALKSAVSSMKDTRPETESNATLKPAGAVKLLTALLSLGTGMSMMNGSSRVVLVIVNEYRYAPTLPVTVGETVIVPPDIATELKASTASPSVYLDSLVKSSGYFWRIVHSASGI